LRTVTLHPPLPNSLTPLVIRTWSFDVYTLLFRDDGNAADVWESLRALVNTGASPSFSLSPNPKLLTLSFALPVSPTSFYALFYASAPSQSPESSFNGWNVYDIAREFARMGVGGDKQRSSAWRFTKVNSDYEVRLARYPFSKLILI
jgi:hypothetical protein